MGVSSLAGTSLDGRTDGCIIYVLFLSLEINAFPSMAERDIFDECFVFVFLRAVHPPDTLAHELDSSHLSYRKFT